MKRVSIIFSIVALLVVNSTSAFAGTYYGSNYTYTTTTTENYSASSPVGQFSNYNATNAQAPVIAINPYPAQGYYDYNYNVPAYTNAGYVAPVYTANAYYGANGTDSEVIASNQNIEVPQNYTKTVTTTDSYVDTREKADKVIDRGLKVVGGLALLGAVGALIVGAIN